MKTPQVPAMAGFAPLGFRDPRKLQEDQAEVARRRAAAPLKPTAPQAACDLGLFGDEPAQIDLIDQVRRAPR
jgi:hypothetical protein